MVCHNCIVCNKLINTEACFKVFGIYGLEEILAGINPLTYNGPHIKYYIHILCKDKLVSRVSEVIQDSVIY
jgi:hypothetical protein